jgi:O-antigen biosynthesis protein
MITSIMMVTYNRLNLTKQTFDSFFQTTTSPYRLIIVDNGSADGTVEYLKTLIPPQNWCVGYETQFNSENKGVAVGRNQALMIAGKFGDPWLATIDNDVILPNNWLNKSLDILKVNPNYIIGVNVEGIEYPLINLNGKTFQFKAKGNLGTVLTVFSRALHEKIGFFNSYNSLFGEDDADYHMRARVAGYQMGYLPENGIHLGQGENDTGAYREMKDKCHAENLSEFRRNCALYANKQKPLYIPFNEDI